MSSGHPCLLNCHLTQVSLPASNRDRDWEGLTSLLVTSLLVTSPRMDPRSLRKTFLSCKIGKRSGEEFHLRGAEQRICNHKFSKVNVLRKKKVRDLWSGRKLSKVQWCGHEDIQWRPAIATHPEPSVLFKHMGRTSQFYILGITMIWLST